MPDQVLVKTSLKLARRWSVCFVENCGGDVWFPPVPEETVAMVECQAMQNGWFQVFLAAQPADGQAGKKPARLAGCLGGGVGSPLPSEEDLAEQTWFQGTAFCSLESAFLTILLISSSNSLQKQGKWAGARVWKALVLLPYWLPAGSEFENRWKYERLFSWAEGLGY